MTGVVAGDYFAARAVARIVAAPLDSFAHSDDVAGVGVVALHCALVAARVAVGAAELGAVVARAVAPDVGPVVVCVPVADLDSPGAPVSQFVAVGAVSAPAVVASVAYVVFAEHRRVRSFLSVTSH